MPSPELNTSRPLLSGSGKFGTPCLRMQAEYAAGLAELEPPDPELLLFAVVEPTCATPGPCEPPQADVTSARPASPTAARVAQASRGGRDWRPSPAVALVEVIAMTATKALAPIASVKPT